MTHTKTPMEQDAIRVSLAAQVSALTAELAEQKKLSTAISRDCNNTANERNALRAENSELVVALKAIYDRLDAELADALDLSQCENECRRIAGKVLANSRGRQP